MKIIIIHKGRMSDVIEAVFAPLITTKFQDFPYEIIAEMQRNLNNHLDS